MHRYQEVARQLEAVIRAGTFRPGDRLPSLRETCRQHRVSTTTAVQAYLTLENEGLIEARPKSGFFVRTRLHERLPEPHAARPARAVTAITVGALQSRLFDAYRQPGVVGFGSAAPSPELLPVEKLSRTLAAVSRAAGGRGLGYDMPPGVESLRRAIARRSLEAGGSLTPEDVITTCGATEALLLCLRAVTSPGDVVAVESPTYFGVLHALQELGLKAAEIPMHPRDGLDLDALEQAVKARRIAACVAVPNFANPGGSLMPEEHKRRLIEILARREVPLIRTTPVQASPSRPANTRSWRYWGLPLGQFLLGLASVGCGQQQRLDLGDRPPTDRARICSIQRLCPRRIQLLAGPTTSLTRPIRTASAAGHPAPGQADLGRAGVADCLHPPLGAAQVRHQAERHLGHRELRILRGDPQIAGQRKLEARSDGHVPARPRC